MYTTQYEGERHALGVFMCGETPRQQVRPLVQWMRSQRGSRKWNIVGNDYSSRGTPFGKPRSTFGSLTTESSARSTSRSHTRVSPHHRSERI
ncbi:MULTISPECIES: transporter substrate-binding protein [unclassified Bradyrhizobium]|uniref:transporter substrate-binding protein n=1 Tax=unclassified Bradyrhizobium TaxID=2631580 RepID=UPI0033960E6F